MKTRAQVMGHPMHPILIVFPSALLPVALIFDLVHLWRGELLWWTMAFWTLLAGVLGTLAAAVPGLLDYTSIPHHHPGKKTATRHMLLGLSLTIVAIVSLLTRDWGRSTDAFTPLIPTGLLLIANLLLIVQGYLGGTLVYEHAIAVHPQHPSEYGEAPAGATRPSGEERRPRPGGGTP